MTRYMGNTVVYIDILPSSFLGLWVCCDLNDLVDLSDLVPDHSRSHRSSRSSRWEIIRGLPVIGLGHFRLWVFQSGRAVVGL